MPRFTADRVCIGVETSRFTAVQVLPGVFQALFYRQGLSEEVARIRELWALNTWPDGWTGDEISGNELINALRITSGHQVVE